MYGPELQADPSALSDELIYWIWLSNVCDAGSSAADFLLEYAGYQPKRLYDATEEEIRSLGDLAPPVVDRLCCKDLKAAYSILMWCRQQQIGILPAASVYYPQRLRIIPCKPILLYYRGHLPNFDSQVCIATVGTRHFSDYGKRNAYTISYDLARCGTVVVSGMAAGIDSFCHRGALDGGGSTVAVLGCGINVLYPRENARLMEEIAAHGLIVTEYPPYTEPRAQNFPIRNRIISGLSQATFVVEADLHSGALITARRAQQQGRKLFALPGGVGELGSRGTNELIRNGAQIVLSAADILEEFLPIYPDVLHPENFPSHLAGYHPAAPAANRKPSAKSPSLDETVRNFVQKISRRPRSETFQESAPSQFAPAKKPKSNPPVPADRSVKDSPTTDSSESSAAAASKPTSSAESSRLRTPSAQDFALMNDTEQKVFALLEGQSMNADDLADAGLPIAGVIAALTRLEINKLIRPLPGGYYTR